MLKARIFRAALALLGAFWALGAPVRADVTVTQLGLSFVPQDIVIFEGETVTWQWTGGGHTVTEGTDGTVDGNEAFHSLLDGLMVTTFPVTFDAAFLAANPRVGQRYDYFCVPHFIFNMIGSVTVIDAPFAYCTGKTTSQGCVPFMDAAGTGKPSPTDTNPFTLRGNDHAAGSSGLLIYGFKKANLNFHGGKLCIKAPITRTAGKASKSKAASLCVGPLTTGRLTTNFNNRIQGGFDPLLTVGQRVFVQWQQRDTTNTVGGVGDNASNGLRFTIGP